MIIALDLATKAGIAWVEKNSNIINVTEVTGLPEEQFLYVKKLMGRKTGNVVLIETFVYFSRSAKTQSSIIKRIGVIEYLLSKTDTTTELLNLNSVRAKYFKGKDKKATILKYFRDNYDSKLTDNHTDALLMILYYMGIALTDDFQIRIV